MGPFQISSVNRHEKDEELQDRCVFGGYSFGDCAYGIKVELTVARLMCIYEYMSGVHVLGGETIGE